MDDTLTPVEQSGIVAKITKKVEKQKEKESNKNKTRTRQKSDLNSKISKTNNSRPSSTKSTKSRPRSAVRPQSAGRQNQDSKRPTSGKSAKFKNNDTVTPKSVHDNSAEITKTTREKSKVFHESDPTSQNEIKNEDIDASKEGGSLKQANSNQEVIQNEDQNIDDSQNTSTFIHVKSSDIPKKVRKHSEEDKPDSDGERNKTKHIKLSDIPKKGGRANEEPETPKEPPTVIVEDLGLSAKKNNTVPVLGLKHPCCVRFTMEGNLVVLDKELGKLFQYNGVTGDKIREFRYLLNYNFQGGFAVTGEDKILVALRSDKYSSISFYKMEGKFKFSAFLDKDSTISGISANSIDEVISLDCKSRAICILNREKRLNSTIMLPREPSDSNDVLPVDVASNSVNDIIIADSANNSIRIYDNKGKFLRSFSHKNAESDRFKYVKRVTTNKSDCILVQDNTPTGDRIDMFDPEGHHLGCPVQVTSGTLIDFDCQGLDRIVALVGSNSVVTLRIYTFILPRKFRKPITRPNPIADPKAKHSPHDKKNGHPSKHETKNGNVNKDKKEEKKADKNVKDKNNNSSTEQKSCCCTIL